MSAPPTMSLWRRSSAPGSEAQATCEDQGGQACNGSDDPIASSASIDARQGWHCRPNGVQAAVGKADDHHDPQTQAGVLPSGGLLMSSKDLEKMVATQLEGLFQGVVGRQLGALDGIIGRQVEGLLDGVVTGQLNRLMEGAIARQLERLLEGVISRQVERLLEGALARQLERLLGGAMERQLQQALDAASGRQRDGEAAVTQQLERVCLEHLGPLRAEVRAMRAVLRGGSSRGPDLESAGRGSSEQVVGYPVGGNRDWEKRDLIGRGNEAARNGGSRRGIEVGGGLQGEGQVHMTGPDYLDDSSARRDFGAAAAFERDSQLGYKHGDVQNQEVSAECLSPRGILTADSSGGVQKGSSWDVAQRTYCSDHWNSMSLSQGVTAVMSLPSSFSSRPGMFEPAIGMARPAGPVQIASSFQDILSSQQTAELDRRYTPMRLSSSPDNVLSGSLESNSIPSVGSHRTSAGHRRSSNHLHSAGQRRRLTHKHAPTSGVAGSVGDDGCWHASNTVSCPTDNFAHSHGADHLDSETTSGQIQPLGVEMSFRRNRPTTTASLSFAGDTNQILSSSTDLNANKGSLSGITKSWGYRRSNRSKEFESASVPMQGFVYHYDTEDIGCDTAELHKKEDVGLQRVNGFGTQMEGGHDKGIKSTSSGSDQTSLDCAGPGGDDIGSLLPWPT